MCGGGGGGGVGSLFSLYIYIEKFKNLQNPMDLFQYNLAGMLLW